MTNFHLLSPEAQLALAERIASNENISLQEAFNKLNLANKDDREAFEKLQDILKAEAEKAKKIFDSEKIQSDFDEGHLTNAKEEREKQEAIDRAEQDRIDELIERSRKIAEQNKLEEFRDAELDENFKFFDAFGNEVVKSDSGFVLKNAIDGVLNSSQLGFIQKAQQTLFANALSKGNFVVLSDEDEIKLARLEQELIDLNKSLKEITIPFEIEINKIQAGAARTIQKKREEWAKSKSTNRRIGKQRSATVAAINNGARTKISAVKARMDKIIRPMKSLITVTTGKILKLKNQFFTFDKINNLRLNIIADVDSFKNHTELTNTDVIILQDLINAGTAFLENALRNNISLSKDQQREIQLAILDAINIQKNIPKINDDFFNNVQDFNDTKNDLVNNEIVVDNDINDFFSSIGDFLGGSGDALAAALDGLNKAFTPNQTDMTAQFVIAARAQQEASKILQSEQNTNRARFG